MPKWTEYTTKDTLADNDEVMLYDATTRANKRGLMSKFWDYVVDKMSTAVISKLETENKTVIGALNYLYGNSKTKISTIQTEYGYLYLKRTINTVGVYGAFENLPLNTERIEITKDFKDFNPNYSYAVVDVKSGAGPFDTVGSLWLYPNGQTMQLYKPANLSRAYITGNYVIQA
jgi:hypothetical protein|nr:MAG TPA: hypothetical protein [Caudoviricetes sp.]